MSRFKELQRIEAAIKNGDKVDLEWAESYCAMRIKIATRREHEKYWRSIQQRVRKATADSD